MGVAGTGEEPVEARSRSWVPQDFRPATDSANRPNRRVAVVLLVAAILLYLPAFWWGAPHATGADRVYSWGVDDVTPLGPLSKAHNIVSRTPDLHPGYPLLHPTLVLAAYAPYLAYVKLTGGLTAPSATYPFGLSDPVTTLRALAWIAHFMSVLFAAGVVVATYVAGRTLANEWTARWAALLTMVAFPMFYYARTGNPDMAVLFFTAAAFAVYARALGHGLSTRAGIWLGAFAGLAMATKEPSVASFLGMPVVLLVLHTRRTGRQANSWRFWQPYCFALLAAVIAYGLGSGLFLAPRWWLQHMTFAQQRVDALASGSVAFFQTFPRTGQGHLALLARIGRHLTEALTLPGFGLAMVGVLWSLHRRDAKAIGYLVPAVTYLGVLFASSRVAQLRYMLPIVLTLSFFAGYALVKAWHTRRTLPRIVAGAAAAAAIALGLLRGIDLTYAMVRDARYDSGAWLARHAGSGDVVEYFGANQNLPPLHAEVITVRANTYRGAVEAPDTSLAAVMRIEARWREQPPAFIIIMPDHSSDRGAPHSASCPPQIYHGLLDGSLGFRLAAKFETASLLPWVKRPQLDYPSVNPPIRIFVAERS